jgi:hypothetical protein
VPAAGQARRRHGACGVHGAFDGAHACLPGARASVLVPGQTPARQTSTGVEQSRSIRSSSVSSSQAAACRLRLMAPEADLLLSSFPHGSRGVLRQSCRLADSCSLARRLKAALSLSLTHVWVSPRSDLTMTWSGCALRPPRSQARQASSQPSYPGCALAAPGDSVPQARTLADSDSKGRPPWPCCRGVGRLPGTADKQAQQAPASGLLPRARVVLLAVARPAPDSSCPTRCGPVRAALSSPPVRCSRPLRAVCRVARAHVRIEPEWRS